MSSREHYIRKKALAVKTKVSTELRVGDDVAERLNESAQLSEALNAHMRFARKWGFSLHAESKVNRAKS